MKTSLAGYDDTNRRGYSHSYCPGNTGKALRACRQEYARRGWIGYHVASLTASQAKQVDAFYLQNPADVAC